jgi:hypothetical protein
MLRVILDIIKKFQNKLCKVLPRSETAQFCWLRLQQWINYLFNSKKSLNSGKTSLYYNKLLFSEKCEHGYLKHVCRDCTSCKVCFTNQYFYECETCTGRLNCVHETKKYICKKCGFYR